MKLRGYYIFFIILLITLPSGCISTIEYPNYRNVDFLIDNTNIFSEEHNKSKPNIMLGPWHHIEFNRTYNYLLSDLNITTLFLNYTWGCRVGHLENANFSCIINIDIQYPKNLSSEFIPSNSVEKIISTPNEVAGSSIFTNITQTPDGLKIKEKNLDKELNDHISRAGIGNWTIDINLIVDSNVGFVDYYLFWYVNISIDQYYAVVN